MNAPLKADEISARRNRAGMSVNKGAMFRVSRMLHAYLSAFAFLALIFFSGTGILLNHPEWFENDAPADRTPVAVSLSQTDISAAMVATDPGRALTQALAGKTQLVGAFSSADIQGKQALIRLEGPKGSSDVDLDLNTGRAQVKVAKASVAGLIQDLHRGKNSGAAWRAVIDASAYVVIALSLIGYILFFSLRFRLRTSLALTAISLLLLGGVVALFVP